MSLKSILVVVLLMSGVAAGAAESAKLNAFERSQGWRLLFDGRDASDWRAFRGEKLPSNWSVREGSLHGSAGTALVSTEEFADFELTFDWRVEEGGRGAVYFRVSEDEAAPEHTGPVMLLVGAGQELGGNGFGPTDLALTPQTGVWYRGRIVVFGYQVEHWLNGDRVLRYLIDTPAWRQAVAASVRGGQRDYGTLRSGRVALSGERVEFRNLKVRPL